jgi:hypothetical protein
VNTDTIDSSSEYEQYNDYTEQTTGIEVLHYSGTRLVGVRVCPRGFANEWSVYVAPAEDAAAVTRLQSLVDSLYTREIGEDYSAKWLSRQALARHVHASKTDGRAYLLTLDEQGDQQNLIL